MTNGMDAKTRVSELFGAAKGTEDAPLWPNGSLMDEIKLSEGDLQMACETLLEAPLLQLNVPDKKLRANKTIKTAWDRRKMKATMICARDALNENRADVASILLDLPQSSYDGAYLMIWIRALEQASAQKSLEDTISLAASLLQDGKVSDLRLEKLVKRMEFQYQVRSQGDVFVENWFPVSKDGVRADLEKLRGLPEKAEISEELLRWVYRKRDDRSLTYAEFRQRALWGNLASNYLRDYSRLLNSDHDLTFDAKTIQDLRTELRDIVDDLDVDYFRSKLDSGQSLVVVLAHTGFMNLVIQRFQKLDLPVIQIGANRVKESQDDSKQFFRTRGNVQTAFLQLIKTVRKTPSLVVIAADGPYGNDLKSLKFLGLPIELAQGAPTIAYHARAQTVYLGTIWDNDRIGIYYREGPIGSRSIDRDRWDDLWFGFYLKCLKEVVQGKPENMRLYSGIWRLIRNALRNPARS